MSNAISPPSFETSNATPRVDMWQYPADFANNPAAEAAAEYSQNQYVNYLAAADTEGQAIEAGQTPAPIREADATPADQLESVPAADQLAGYATRTGAAIDSQHAEAVLAATAEAVAHATPATYNRNAPFAATTGEAYTPVNEAPVSYEERQRNHNAAVQQAGVYAGRIEAMRDRALIEWGAQGE